MKSGFFILKLNNLFKAYSGIPSIKTFIKLFVSSSPSGSISKQYFEFSVLDQ